MNMTNQFNKGHKFSKLYLCHNLGNKIHLHTEGKVYCNENWNYF